MAVVPGLAAVGKVDIREQRLFRSLDLDNDQRIPRHVLEQVLTGMGLRTEDARLAESLAALSSKDTQNPGSLEENVDASISMEEFCAAIRHNILLIERALQGDLIIPDFENLCAEISRIFDKVRNTRDGRAADYIPQLDLKEPELDQFGVSLCTIDGQRFDVGDSNAFFSIQSTCKPINYCLAFEEHGEDLIHRYVGHEPSGLSFNELTLDKLNRPHNPLINAGAIMTASLIKLKDRRNRIANAELSERDARGWAGSRFEHVMNNWEKLCGGKRPRASLSTYLSECRTADRNFALGYYMREKRSFPEDVEMEDVLDFFFQCCSIEMTTQMMSTVAATLANGGICPLTGERVFRADTVRRCLSLMSSCGMYDFSGEFAFKIGLPAKSGVSGAMMIVIPNVMGICCWSPRLDELGNSVRGIEFCRELIDRFNFHHYDNFACAPDKTDPRINQIEKLSGQVNKLIWAASKGDLHAIQQQSSSGADLGCADYDGRTPLHLAAAEGRISVIEFLIEQYRQNKDSLDLNPRDRWGGTPLDDACSNGHQAVVELLQQAGAKNERGTLPGSGYGIGSLQIHPETSDTNTMIWAASVGDLTLIRRLVARGTSLMAADYDRRTPLHLAAAEGHQQVLAYLLAHMVELDPVDRWGHTPLDEAIRHNQLDAIRLLKSEGAGHGIESAETGCDSSNAATALS